MYFIFMVLLFYFIISIYYLLISKAELPRMNASTVEVSLLVYIIYSTCVCVCVQEYVGHLMQDLRQNSEQSLQFLRFRLDFNQYYSLTLGMDTSVSA